MKNKKIIILIGLLLVVLSITFIVLKNIIKDNDSKQKITLIAEKFYEDTYYQATNKDILKEFTDKGIIISLEELIEFEEEDKKDYKEYNMSKSNIEIYPKKPYKKEDYTIKIKLYRN